MRSRYFVAIILLLAPLSFLLLTAVAPDGVTSIQKTIPGLKRPVEILRDRWGVRHIYAENSADLFFAQGYVTANDRLFQLDLWRRIGAGQLSEVLGPNFIGRDRIARLVRYRGNWDDEWNSYGPDMKQIA